jgi:hypothetical protein
MTNLVLKELRLRHAQLDLRAERLRTQQRSTPATSARALPLARQVKDVQKQADDYARLIEAAGEL